MDDSFDPYRKWLGIPPEEQPPHHYRLLGLELFEADPDVIVNAADARLSYLRSLSKDKHADMADRIAAQIKEVQLCLLDPAKKAFYDGQLQRRIAALKREPNPAAAAPYAAGNASAVPPAKPAAVPLPPRARQTPAAVGGSPPPFAPAAEFTIPELHIPAAYSLHSARPLQQRWHRLAAMILGLAAVICLLIFLLVKFNRVDETSPSVPIARTTPETEIVHGEKSTPAVPQLKPAAERAKEKTKENPAVSPGGAAMNPVRENSPSAIMPPPPSFGSPPAEPDFPGSNPFEEGGRTSPFTEIPRIIEHPLPPENSGSNTAASGKHGSLDSNFGKDEDPSSPRKSARKRQPIPAETARQAAEKKVREIYGLKIAAAKNGAEKIALSNQIWRQSLDAENDAAARYALMSIACQLAGESGRLQVALNRAESFAEYFEADPWDLKVQAVVKSVKAAQSALAARVNPSKIDGGEIVLLGRQFAEEAKDAGEIEAAQKAVKAIAPLAKKDPLLAREMNVFGKEIERLAARYQPARKALNALKENPDDAEANALAGRWTCFESHDWDKGLPMLAKSSDAALAELAAKDLITLEGADKQLATADAWWDFAQKEKEKGAVKSGALLRADYWYDRALPNLAGLDKAKAEERMKSIAGVDAAAASGRGVIQAGNVALAKNGTHVEGVKFNAVKLLDGDSRNTTWDGGAANSPVPCEWTITFDQVYQLRQIRFHFYDGDARFYHYAMAVSADGVNYKPLLDRNVGQSFKWQIIPLNGMPVKSVKLFGTYSYRNRVFSVTEFEAYCIPPKP